LVSGMRDCIRGFGIGRAGVRGRVLPMVREQGDKGDVGGPKVSGGWPYNTAMWRKLRAAKLRADPMCEYCPPQSQALATEVDHRVAINNGGNPWDWGNLASSCHECHSSKTAADKTGRPWVRKGCGPDGMPLDPGHPCYTTK
jgi:5-methylcytosine-specific restriction protein A